MYSLGLKHAKTKRYGELAILCRHSRLVNGPMAWVRGRTDGRQGCRGWEGEAPAEPLVAHGSRGITRNTAKFLFFDLDV